MSTASDALGAQTASAVGSPCAKIGGRDRVCMPLLRARRRFSNERPQGAEVVWRQREARQHGALLPDVHTGRSTASRCGCHGRYCAPATLLLRKSLEAPKKLIEQVYFIESGFASVVANGTSKPGIEVGSIGREGMTGLAIVLGSDRAQHATYVQVAGKGLRISATRLRCVSSVSGWAHARMRSRAAKPNRRAPS
jgi:hypothetical protein